VTPRKDKITRVCKITTKKEKEMQCTVPVSKCSQSPTADRWFQTRASDSASWQTLCALQIYRIVAVSKIGIVLWPSSFFNSGDTFG